MKRLFALTLPVALFLPLAPSVSVWFFHLTEPSFVRPLETAGPLQVREDPYGSGEFLTRRSGGRKHQGVDWTAPVGTPVAAAKSGRAFVGRLKNGLGRYVEIHHPDGWLTRYAHLKTIVIRDGQAVRQGQRIGTVGKSGNAGRRLIRPHLHFEVRNPRGLAVNPWRVMDEKGD
ncbi:MAG: M23 family metallopeptidase [Candidatus Omnitrophica bacterium]|nr:M23 family metallopeptidase [Candidatus Omnitrophota bacterium]